MMPTETTDNKVFLDGIDRAAQQKGVAEQSKSVIMSPEDSLHYRRLDRFRRRLQGMLAEVEQEMAEMRQS